MHNEHPENALFFGHVRQTLSRAGLSLDGLVELPGEWPTIISLLRTPSGTGQRFLPDIFEIFVPTRPIALTERSGDLHRRSFQYQRGMIAFNPPHSQWSIEWQGTLEGVCFYFAPQTMERAARRFFGEQPRELEWRLALSDHAPAIAYLALDIASQMTNNLPAGKAHVETLIEALLALVIRRFSHSAARDTAQVGILSPQVLRATQYIRTNLARRIALQDVCDHSAASLAQLNRLFRMELGNSVWNYVIECRIALAEEKLRGKSASIENIASQCGFASVDNFIRQFRKRKGETPIAFRAGQAVPEKAAHCS